MLRLEHSSLHVQSLDVSRGAMVGTLPPHVGTSEEVEAARIRKELSARPMLDDAPVAAEDDKPVPLAIRAPVDLDL